MELTALLARIIARYLAGAMVSLGFLSPDLAVQLGGDPDVIGFIGLALGAVTEIGYTLARRLGWAT